MAIQLRPLPPEVFPEEARPYIKHLNVVLRDLCALEGTIRDPLQSRRSDLSIARRNTFQVAVSRITPSISEVVSGVSTVVGAPQLTFSTSNIVGSTTTAVSINSTIALFGTQVAADLASTATVGSSAYGARADHAHRFGPTLRSTANGATLTFADDTIDTSLTNSLGALGITSVGAFSLNVGGRITFNLANSASASALTIAPHSTASEGNVITVQGRPVAGNRSLMIPAWFSPASGDTFSSQTFRCWDAQFSTFAGQHTSSTIVGYDATTISIAPSSGSTSNNNLYGFRNGPTSFSISNANGSWADVAAAYFKGVRRSITSPFIDVQATVIIEPPTAGVSAQLITVGSSQIGLYIRQQGAQAVAADRIAIKVDAQNSGTRRWSFYGVSDVLYQGGNIACIGLLGVTGIATFGSSISVAGTMRHNGTYASLYGATPTIQYATTGTTNGFTANASANATFLESTYTGDTGTAAYTISDAIRALKLIGAIAY